jgi:hypothetical protein
MTYATSHRLQVKIRDFINTNTSRSMQSNPRLLNPLEERVTMYISFVYFVMALCYVLIALHHCGLI